MVRETLNTRCRLVTGFREKMIIMYYILRKLAGYDILKRIQRSLILNH